MVLTNLVVEIWAIGFTILKRFPLFLPENSSDRGSPKAEVTNRVTMMPKAAPAKAQIRQRCKISLLTSLSSSDSDILTPVFVIVLFW